MIFMQQKLNVLCKATNVAVADDAKKMCSMYLHFLTNCQTFALPGIQGDFMEPNGSYQLV